MQFLKNLSFLGVGVGGQRCWLKFKSSVVLNAIYHHQNPAEPEASFGL